MFKQITSKQIQNKMIRDYLIENYLIDKITILKTNKKDINYIVKVLNCVLKDNHKIEDILTDIDCKLVIISHN